MNSSNLTNSTLPSTTTSSVTYTFTCYSGNTSGYVYSGLGVFIIITNIINILVYSHESLRKTPMNVFLLAKSVTDLYYGLEISMEPIGTCYGCIFAQIYGLRYFALFYRQYFGFIAQFSSILLEIAATLDRYVTISQKCKFFKKIHYKYVIAGIYLFCFLFFIFCFFIYTIRPSVLEDGEVDWVISYSDFGTLIGRAVFQTIHFSLRDGVCVVVLLILNILILLTMKKAMAKKKTISSSGTTKSSIATGTKSKADRAELKITIMVVLTGITTMYAHTLKALVLLPLPAFYPVTRTVCFTNIAGAQYTLSYGLNLFYFLIFNNIFRNRLAELFGKLNITKSIASEKSITGSTKLGA